MKMIIKEQMGKDLLKESTTLIPVFETAQILCILYQKQKQNNIQSITRRRLNY